MKKLVCLAFLLGKNGALFCMAKVSTTKVIQQTQSMYQDLQDPALQRGIARLRNHHSTEAFPLMKEAALSADPRSQAAAWYFLGEIYNSSLKLKNSSLAQHYWQRVAACEANKAAQAWACARLGQMSQDMQEAVLYFEKAKALLPADAELHKIIEASKSALEVPEVEQKAAAAETVMTQSSNKILLQAERYIHGSQYDYAVRRFKEVVDSQDLYARAEAWYRLGEMYSNGKGVRKNQIEAIRYWKKAAGQTDNGPAQAWALAQLAVYLQGSDLKQAQSYCTRAQTAMAQLPHNMELQEFVQEISETLAKKRREKSAREVVTQQVEQQETKEREQRQMIQEEVLPARVLASAEPATSEQQAIFDNLMAKYCGGFLFFEGKEVPRDLIKAGNIVSGVAFQDVCPELALQAQSLLKKIFEEFVDMGGNAHSVACAQSNLGCMHFNGWGTLPDLNTARTLWEAVVANRLISFEEKQEAIIGLAAVYSTRGHALYDFKKAYQYMQQEMAFGGETALRAERDLEKLLKSEITHPSEPSMRACALLDLGKVYCSCREPNFEKGYECYLKVLQEKDADPAISLRAQLNLGALCYVGHGVEKDVALARRCWEAVAHQDIDPATALVAQDALKMLEEEEELVCHEKRSFTALDDDEKESTKRLRV